MKMGPDAGRNFLSTRDPVETRINIGIPDAAKKPGAGSTEGRPVSLNQILRQFYFGRSSGK
jgi:hypothetical protein